MLVTVDKTRILHLLTLITGTVVGGYILTHYYEWGRLPAYGLTCTLSCQISDAILKVRDEKRKVARQEHQMEKRRLKKQAKDEQKKIIAESGGSSSSGSNPKRKMKRKNANQNDSKDTTTVLVDENKNI